LSEHQSHPYIPLTDDDRAAMLATVGVPSTDALFDDIPAEYRRPRLCLPDALSELELLDDARELASRNRTLRLQSPQFRTAQQRLPSRTPVNASPQPLRVTTHDSGPPWAADPLTVDPFIHNISPVYPGTQEECQCQREVYTRRLFWLFSFFCLQAWAEDTALLGSNRSADPGAKTERRATDSSLARLSPIPFGIGSKAINPSRRSRESSICELPGEGLPNVSSVTKPVLYFTLNQYSW